MGLKQCRMKKADYSTDIGGYALLPSICCGVDNNDKLKESTTNGYNGFPLFASSANSFTVPMLITHDSIAKNSRIYVNHRNIIQYLNDSYYNIAAFERFSNSPEQLSRSSSITMQNNVSSSSNSTQSIIIMDPAIRMLFSVIDSLKNSFTYNNIAYCNGLNKDINEQCVEYINEDFERNRYGSMLTDGNADSMDEAMMCKQTRSMSELELPPNAVDHMLNITHNITDSTTATTNNSDTPYATGTRHHAAQGNIALNTQHEAKNGQETQRVCMPPCFWSSPKQNNHGKPPQYKTVVHSCNERPQYNSLCTRCMPEEDKIGKGYKGLLIHSPIFKYVNEPKTMVPINPTSPSFNRNFIVQQTALVNGKQITDVYYLHPEKLGKGSYGNVMKANHLETGEVKAVKIIRKEKIHNSMRMKREIQIMKTLDHPNIIKLYEVYEDATNLYLVMEMCNGGELFDRIVKNGCFTEQNAATIMRQVFSAISYCHSKNILHRDLKPENILYSTSEDSTVKIIDWGFATKCFKSHKFSSLVGTPYYVAPEVLLGNYDRGCDIWSAGVILFILLVGYPPFHGNDHNTILKSVKRGCINFVPQHWKNVSREAIDLITRCLSYDPKTRISARDAWRHEWIVKNIKKDKTSYVAPSLSRDLINRFKEFHQFNKMKKIALTCIAYHLTDMDVGCLNKAFEALNTKGDGVLSISDMIYRLQATQSRGEVKQYPDPATERLIEQMDVDGSGTIDYTAFLAATIDEKHYKDRDFCRKAFKVFDLDGSGKITRENLVKMFHKDLYDPQLTDGFIEDIFNEVDLDNDGVIDYEEFCTMLFGLSNRNIPNVEYNY